MTGARRAFTVILVVIAVFTTIGQLSASASVKQVQRPGVTALWWAEQHETGAPYVWGGSGPWGYDCSGAAMTAYEHAGIWLPHYTVAMLYSGHLRWTRYPHPGDLVMWGGGYPYHVEIYVRPGVTFGAQDYGTTVGFHQIWGYPSYYEVV